MTIKQFMLYNLFIIPSVLWTHEFGHFLVARWLGYDAKIQIQPLKLKFVTVVYDLKTIRHQKLVALSGCLATICLACLLNILAIDHNFKSLFNIYTFVFLLNLHPQFPDGQIFWQKNS